MKATIDFGQTDFVKDDRSALKHRYNVSLIERRPGASERCVRARWDNADDLAQVLLNHVHHADYSQCISAEEAIRIAIEAGQQCATYVRDSIRSHQPAFAA